MNTSREELLQEMDMILAKQKDRIEKIQDKETKKDLENIARAVENLHFKIQMDDGLKIRTADKRMSSFYGSLAQIFKGKYVKNILLAFIAGIILTLIPTILYISSLKGDNNFKVEFIPNAIGYWKPTYVESINSPEKLEAVKKSRITDSNLITLGGVVKLGKRGLVAISGEEMRSPGYHTKDVGLQENLIKNISGYIFRPDTVFTLDPVMIQILYTDLEVNAWKTKDISPKSFLSIGAGIICPAPASCFVTAKTTLDNEYEKVVPLSEL